MKAVALLLLVIAYAAADIYMHNPRGSNGRVNEANVNRNNANRLMDTQNNAKGGYCLGPAMSYYEGSLLMVEWTHQHGCGNPKTSCNTVIQYMCGNTDANLVFKVRDGTTTDRIGENLGADNGVTATANSPYFTEPVGQYGMHETYFHYRSCRIRNRNRGLFIADRETLGQLNNNNNGARFTRQNNNANRHGFECPEERDYWPYWHNSPWRDVVVFTDRTDLCPMFRAESQNVKAKGICIDEENTDAEFDEYGLRTPAPENNEMECRAAGKTWTEDPAHNIPAPDCLPNPYTRDNHLGNTMNGENNVYNWTIPTSEHLECVKGDNCDCVLRIRYNISSNIDGWGFVDATSNGRNSPVVQNPTVPTAGFNFTLAINTNQFGRTFEDRSHVFHIRPRPDGVPQNQRIFNLNVRGKRGNIVQAYPSVEYDFIPDKLVVRVNDYIHFQWTGCDTNPAGNAGEGTDQTDRSNCVQMMDLEGVLPATDEWLESNKPLFESPELRRHMAMAGQKESDCDLNSQDNNAEDNCFKLNAAPMHFDGGLIKMNTTGVFHYMSTRNHSFTNRDQKGSISVVPLLPTWAIAVVIVGAILFAGAAVAGVAMIYAKKNPGSGAAEFFNKFEGAN